jgi:hypothetical protein
MKNHEEQMRYKKGGTCLVQPLVMGGSATSPRTAFAVYALIGKQQVLHNTYRLHFLLYLNFLKQP